MQLRRPASISMGLPLVLALGVLLALGLGVYGQEFDADESCTVVVVGKLASVDGSVINSHNCDGGYDTGLMVVPAADHPEGTMVPVLWGNLRAVPAPVVKGEIPEVSHTYQYFHIGYPIGNEYQVFHGEHTIGGNPACRATDLSDAIMEIEQLQIHGLQRAKTARESIQVMGQLAEEWGYSDGAEVLAVSDPNEVWVFEIFGVGPAWKKDSGKPGAVWCAQRVPDDHIYVSPNMSRIDKVDPTDTENFMVSPHYLETAIELGIYDPDSGREFSWRETYGYIWPRMQTAMSSRAVRLWRALTLLAPSAEGPGGYGWVFGQQSDYPFSVKPDKLVSFQDVRAVLTDMNEGTPYDNTEDPAWFVQDRSGNWVKSPLATPQPSSEMMALIKMTSTVDRTTYWRPGAVPGCSYHWVSQSRNWLPNEIGGVVWFGHDNGNMSVIVPVYCGNTHTPPSWAVADRSKLNRDSAYWATALVDDLVNQYYQLAKPVLDEVRLPLQQEYYDAQAAIEQGALDIYNNSGPEEAIEYLTTYSNSAMLRVEATYWELVDRFLFLNNSRSRY